jgi:hypothetical protein
MQKGMKEADNSHGNEGDMSSRGFGVLPPGSRCRRKNVKSFRSLLQSPVRVVLHICDIFLIRRMVKVERKSQRRQVF